MIISLDFINDVMSDVMSVKSGVFLLLLSLLTSTFRNLLDSDFSRRHPWFNNMANHVCMRLIQLTSPLSCFAIGFAISLGCMSSESYVDDAFILAGMVFFVGIAMSAFAFAALIIERGILEYCGIGFSLLLFIGAGGYLIKIAVYGF